MKVKIIACIAKNCVIGNCGSLPWDLPEEMRHFIKETNEHIVIMGWNTYCGMAGRLDKRFNIVIDKSLSDNRYYKGINFVPSLSVALELAGESEYSDTAYIIGGAKTYQEAFDKHIVDELVLSMLPDSYDGDSYFPDYAEVIWDFDNMKVESHNGFEVRRVKSWAPSN